MSTLFQRRSGTSTGTGGPAIDTIARTTAASVRTELQVLTPQPGETLAAGQHLYTPWGEYVVPAGGVTLDATNPQTKATLEARGLTLEESDGDDPRLKFYDADPTGVAVPTNAKLAYYLGREFIPGAGNVWAAVPIASSFEPTLLEIPAAAFTAHPEWHTASEALVWMQANNFPVGHSATSETPRTTAGTADHRYKWTRYKDDKVGSTRTPTYPRYWGGANLTPAQIRLGDVWQFYNDDRNVFEDWEAQMREGVLTAVQISGGSVSTGSTTPASYDVAGNF